MKKFEKAVLTSVLAVGAAVGSIVVGSQIEHAQDQDRINCYERLDDDDQAACLSEIPQSTNGEQLLEVTALISMIGAFAAGVQAYRALDKEN